MINITNQIAYLRTTRNFPATADQLTVEINKAYVDIANAVNVRIIGIFSINRPSQTGESWYLANQLGQTVRRQATLRQVYKFNDDLLTIPHTINFNTLTNFTRIWGTFFDGTNWNTLPYVDVVAADNQINVKVDEDNIIVTKGAGTPPSIQNGLIVLEYLANP